MARISIDNGATFIGHTDKKGLKAAIKAIGWETIAYNMDMELANYVHMLTAPCSHVRFLQEYLLELEAETQEDFVIG